MLLIKQNKKRSIKITNLKFLQKIEADKDNVSLITIKWKKEVKRKDWAEELCFDVFPEEDEIYSLIVIDGDDGEDQGDIVNEEEVTKVNDTYYIIDYPDWGKYHFKLNKKLN